MTIRTTALALCYSTAEYAAPVWERSAYAHLLNPGLNRHDDDTVGLSHYWMSKANKRRELVFARGISPPEIRRSVCARVERTKQVERETHSLFGHTPARRYGACLLCSGRKDRELRSLFTCVQSVHFPAKVVRVMNGREDWRRRHMQA